MSRSSSGEGDFFYSLNVRVEGGRRLSPRVYLEHAFSRRGAGTAIGTYLSHRTQPQLAP